MTRTVAGYTAALNAPDDAPCRFCTQPKSAHGKMGFACPAPWKTVFQRDAAPTWRERENDRDAERDWLRRER